MKATQTRTMKQALASPHSMVELTLEVSLFNPPLEFMGKKTSHSSRLFFSLNVEGMRATSRFLDDEIPSVIAALKRAIRVITDWQGLSFPGEVSEIVYKREDSNFPIVTVKAQEEYRWIQWEDRVHPELMMSIGVNLSFDQAEILVRQLEQVPDLKQQLAETLKSLP